jgi:heme oxygenase
MERSELQLRLKNETKSLHDLAENNAIMKSFIDGTFKPKHLLRFLVNIKPVYDVVEQRLLQSYIAINPDLKRSELIQQDINALANDFNSANDDIGYLLTPLEVTDLWVGWSWSKPKDMLKAELYTRWLGDLYGGRMMIKNMGKFTKSLEFIDVQKAILDVRSILDVHSIDVTNDDIIDESKKVFEYHVELFTAIENE